MSDPTNDEIADRLDEVGRLLELQHANPFRVRAYHQAADMLRGLDRSVAQIAKEEGRDALVGLPRIGRGIASAIEEMVHTGRFELLERLRGELSPEKRFMSLPGIGEELASRIHHQLHVDTLEELEVAAHDGRLAELSGFGESRVLAVRQALATILRRSSRDRFRRVGRGDDHAAEHEPDVALLLELDREYRERAEAGRLPTIAPRRFNPSGESWLPIMHDERDGWSFTVLFSNTARAHELEHTRDWVVIFFERDGDEGQRTVVTEYAGPLAGERIVRGREAECRRLASTDA